MPPPKNAPQVKSALLLRLAGADQGCCWLSTGVPTGGAAVGSSVAPMPKKLKPENGECREDVEWEWDGWLANGCC